VVVFADCIARGGACAAVVPGPLCGTGNLLSCADILADGDASLAGLNADLAALMLQKAGLATIFDPCEGRGPEVACPGGVATLASQTITSSQVWPAHCRIRLVGLVAVRTPPGAPATVLTIEPGTIIEAAQTVDASPS